MRNFVLLLLFCVSITTVWSKVTSKSRALVPGASVRDSNATEYPSHTASNVARVAKALNVTGFNATTPPNYARVPPTGGAPSNSSMMVICALSVIPNVVCNSSSSSTDISGFDVEVFRQAAAYVGLIEEIDYVFQCSSALATQYDFENNISVCYAVIGAVNPNLTLQASGIIYSYPYYRSTISAVVAGQTVTGDLWGFFSPFSWSLWVAMIITAVILPFKLWFLETLHSHSEFSRNFIKFFTIWWQCVGMFLNIDTLLVESLPAKIITAMYGFMILILVNSYTANLTAFLTVQNVQTQFNSVSQLQNKLVGTFQPYVSRLQGYGVLPYILGSTLSETNNTDLEAYTQLLIDGSLSAVAMDYAIATRMVWLDSTCTLLLLGSNFGTRDYAVAFQQDVDLTLVSSFNHAFLQMLNSERITDIASSWLNPNNNFCAGTGVLLGSSSTQSISSLTFKELSGLWIVLTCAFGAAALLVIFSDLAWRYGSDETREWQNRFLLVPRVMQGQTSLIETNLNEDCRMDEEEEMRREEENMPMPQCKHKLPRMMTNQGHGDHHLHGRGGAKRAEFFSLLNVLHQQLVTLEEEQAKIEAYVNRI